MEHCYLIRFPHCIHAHNHDHILTHLHASLGPKFAIFPILMTGQCGNSLICVHHITRLQPFKQIIPVPSHLQKHISVPLILFLYLPLFILCLQTTTATQHNPNLNSKSQYPKSQDVVQGHQDSNDPIRCLTYPVLPGKLRYMTYSTTAHPCQSSSHTDIPYVLFRQKVATT